METPPRREPARKAKGRGGGVKNEVEDTKRSTAMEYEELVAGLTPPQGRFVASAFDIASQFSNQQAAQHQAQQVQGGRMLAAEWAPTLHMLQRLGLEKPKQHTSSSIVDSWIGIGGCGGSQGAGGDREAATLDTAESRLFSQCLQALEEDISFWEGENGETPDMRGERSGESHHGSSSSSHNSTGRILQQLGKGRLIQKGGHLFSSLDADPEVYTSSSEDDEGGGTSCSGGGSHKKISQVSRHRFAAPVLPLRHALRFLRSQQRDSLRTQHLLSEWREGDGCLSDLQKVLAYWGPDGVYSVAKAAQKMKTDMLAINPLQAKHITNVLQQLDEVSTCKSRRREFRQWALAAQNILAGGGGGKGDNECPFPLSLEALFVLAEESTGRWFEGLPSIAVRSLLDDSERREVIKRLEILQGKYKDTDTMKGKSKGSKGLRGDRAQQQQHHEELKQVESQALQPPPCFSSHGNDTLRCTECAFWLVQLQQLQQIQREGTCGLLAQAPKTHFVRFMLVMQRHRQQLPALANWACQLAEGLHEDGFKVRWLHDDGGKGPDEEKKTTKFYAGHLGAMHSTVWGGAFCSSRQTHELLFWIRQLGPFRPLQLSENLSLRSHERKALMQRREQLLSTRRCLYSLPSFVEPERDASLEEGKKKGRAAKVSLSAYSYSLLSGGEGDSMQIHTDADSTETEGEVEERRKIAAARRRCELKKMSKVGKSPGALSREGHRKRSALIESESHTPFNAGDSLEGKLQSCHEDSLDLGKGLFYLGSGFAHLNTSWSYKPPKRRLTAMPAPSAATASGSSANSEHGRGRLSEKKNRSGKNAQLSQDGGEEAEGDKQREESGPRGQGPAAASWTVETSSSDESVRAFVSDDAKYRRSFRAWRRRVNRRGPPKISRTTMQERPARQGTSGLTTSDSHEMEEPWQGHVLDAFLARLGSISVGRYVHLATAAARAAAIMAASSRRKKGSRHRKRQLGSTGPTADTFISSEQRAAQERLAHLQPRQLWRGNTEGSYPGSMGGCYGLVAEPKKVSRLERKHRVRSVEPSWDLQQQEKRCKRGSQGNKQGGGTNREASGDHSYPYGMVATGRWGGVKRSTKSREVQLVCLDESEVYRRLGKTKLYQQKLHGLEDKLSGRREYYAVVDEENKKILMIPGGSLVFFLTETRRQSQEDYLCRLFADIRRQMRGTFLQCLLAKRRNARNVLLMNAMLWQNQLKHVHKARLCLLLGGYWRDAAFAAGDAPLTEQQLLDDFVAVNNMVLADVTRAREPQRNEGSSARNVGCRLIEAIRSRWVEAGTASFPDSGWRASQEDDSGVASAAADMQLPAGIVERIDEAAGEAAGVAAAAVACADRNARDMLRRHMLPRLLLRYIQHIFPLFVQVYLTARSQFALQKSEEQEFSRRVRQVGSSSTGSGAKATAGGFSGDVLRSQYDEFARHAASQNPLNSDDSTNAFTFESQMKEMLPPYNATAVTPAELFNVSDLFPLRLLQEAAGENDSFSAAPFEPFVKGGNSGLKVDLIALEESWGRFAVDLARHIGQARRAHRDGEADGGNRLFGTLSVDELAKFVKVVRVLAGLFSRQNKTFFGVKGLGSAFKVYVGRAKDRNNGGSSFEVLPSPVLRWIARTFLQQDEQEQLFLSRENQTKLLATLLWLCASTSPEWRFDFESLLVHEWRGRYDTNFEACASLIGLKHTGDRSKRFEYRLQLPCPLTESDRDTATRAYAPIHSLFADDKKKRRRGH
ncbi:hypothetical protein CSUI_000290 [Cystoisospora suis]|uniref:Uncharacterized protein n=1 Tax=Cystoisospora suis TaxID=483139 RepID=A0A2C6LGY7_9APIC|nr:hypothetical protein CSUI_000290 [Cystoisospora suis]